MRGRMALQSTACEMHQKRRIRFAKAFGVRTRPRVAFMVELRLSRPVRLLFGTQRHDWPGTRLTLRVRGPFPPIWCSQSMGPDPTGQGSNGDVQNDASTQESCRDQTAVPLR